MLTRLKVVHYKYKHRVVDALVACYYFFRRFFLLL